MIDEPYFQQEKNADDPDRDFVFTGPYGQSGYLRIGTKVLAISQWATRHGGEAVIEVYEPGEEDGVPLHKMTIPI